MTGWKRFESDCVDYLNECYQAYKVYFVGVGGSDSTTSDIKVLKNSILKFFIEAKMPYAQSGQFVILDNGDEFHYSEQNRGDLDDYSQFILDYINTNYEFYKQVTTRSNEIKLDERLFANWIIDYYESKGVRYVISRDDYSYIIFPIEKFNYYFRISANLRIKASGSRPMALYLLKDFQAFCSQNYGRCEVFRDGPKTYLKTNRAIMDKEKVTFDAKRYQLNFVDNGLYEIRLLSDTRNPNVIFKVNLISKQRKTDLLEFIHDIK